MNMKRYSISSKAGTNYGVFEGKTEAEALLTLHRDAGYGESTVWLSNEESFCSRWLGRVLVFASDDDRKLCGDTCDWIIKEC